MAEVKAVDADEVTLHYYGTTSKKRKNAHFRPAHLGCRSGMMILAEVPTQTDGEKNLPWTDKVHPELVICKVDLKVTSNKNGARKLTKGSEMNLQGFGMARM